MKKIPQIIERSLKYVALVAIALVTGVSASYAGSLTPSALPAKTLVTLGDLYTLVNNGFSTSSVDFETPGSVSPTFRSIGDIFNLLSDKISDISSDDIVSGVTIFGVTGTHVEGEENAVVPENAPILPPQAFVDASMDGSWADFGVLDLSDRGITHIDITQSEHYTYLQNNLGEAASFDFSGNDLSRAEIDSILSSLASLTVSSGYLNFSGGTNATPTPVSVYSPGTTRIDLSLLESSDSIWDYDDYRRYIFYLESSVDLADSTVTPGDDPAYTVQIGVQDNPTAVQMAAKLAELMGWDHNGEDAIVTFVYTSPYDLPFYKTGSGAITFPIPGNHDRPNVDLANLIDFNNWTVEGYGQNGFPIQ